MNAKSFMFQVEMTSNKCSWSIKYKVFLEIQSPQMFMSHASFLRRPLKRWVSLKQGSKLKEIRWDRRHRRLHHKIQMKGIPNCWWPGWPLQPSRATGPDWSRITECFVGCHRKASALWWERKLEVQKPEGLAHPWGRGRVWQHCRLCSHAVPLLLWRET